jgi:hypothetical protein
VTSGALPTATRRTPSPATRASYVSSVLAISAPMRGGRPSRSPRASQRGRAAGQGEERLARQVREVDLGAGGERVGHLGQPLQQARDLGGFDLGMLAELVEGRRDQR